MSDFETLYCQHAAALLRFAWGLCGHRSQAEDLVSETFVRVLQRAPKVETRTARAYLLVVARNTYITGWRRRRREVPLEIDVVGPEEDPTTRLDDKARLEAVIRSLAELPEGERSALLLRVDHGLSYAEIASALGTSPSAARVRVHRARIRLTEILERQGRTS